MKRRSTFFVAGVWALATAALPAAVFAQSALNSTTSTTPTTTSSNSTATAGTTNTTSTSTAPSTTLDERVAKRKSDLKTRLDFIAQKKLVAKCKAAQTVLTNMKTRNQASTEKRSKTYQTIQTGVADMLGKLKNQNVDTTELNTVSVALDSKIKLYTADSTTYAQSLDDAIALDCVKDPAGFKATLDSLRAQRLQVQKDAADIRSLQPQLAKALNGLGVILANKQGTGSSQGGTQ